MGTQGNLLTSPASTSTFAPAEATLSEKPGVCGLDSQVDHSSADPQVSELTEGVRCIQGYFSFNETLRNEIPSALIARLVEPALPCSEYQLFRIVCDGLTKPPSEDAVSTPFLHDDDGPDNEPVEPASKKRKSCSPKDQGDNVVVIDLSSDDEEEEARQDQVVFELLDMADCLPDEAVTESSEVQWKEFQNRCNRALGFSPELFHQKIVDEVLWLVDKVKPNVYRAGFDIETWKRDLQQPSPRLLELMKRLDDGIDFDGAVLALWPKGASSSKTQGIQKRKQRERTTPRLPSFVQRIVNYTQKFETNSETSTEPQARIHSCPSQIRPSKHVSRCFCLYEQVANMTPMWETEAARIIMKRLHPHLEFYIMNSLQAGGSSSRCRFYGVTPPPDDTYPKANTGAPNGKTIKDLYDPPWPKDRAWPAWAANIYPDGFLKCIRTKLVNSILNVNDINTCIREAHRAGRNVLQDEDFLNKHRKIIIDMNLVPDPAHEDGSCQVLQDHMAEKALGFPEGHLSGYGRVISYETQKRRWIGDSFCIHSVMHCMQKWQKLQADGRWAKDGAVALSLFDGIGGGPVAVHKAGIDVRHWILVEKDEMRTKVVEEFLKKQRFTSIPADVFKKQQLVHLESEKRTFVVFHGNNAIEKFMEVFCGWSAITMLIGGSPCENITTSNRTPTYLQGPSSGLFKHYADAVANIYKSGDM